MECTGALRLSVEATTGPIEPGVYHWNPEQPEYDP